MSSQIDQFNRLESHHKQVIEAITSRFEPYSDFNFVSLYSWDTDSSLRWKIVNNNLIVKFKEYGTDHHFYSMIGDVKINKALDELLSTSREEQLSTSLELIPESVVNSINDKSAWIIIEDEANMDYVLSIPEQVELRGNKFASKRYNINKFHRLYPHAEIQDIDLGQKTAQYDILQLFDDWADRKGSAGEAKTINERIALERIFDLIDVAALLAIGVYVDGRLKNFVIYEEIADGYVMAHFQKGLPEYYGIFTVCLHHACIKLYQNGYQWMNIEQALGESGLALSKELYRPAKYLRKFTLQSQVKPA